MVPNEISLNDLVLFGGLSQFHRKLHVNRPHFVQSNTFDRRLNRIVASQWFTNNGPTVHELESRLCETLQVDHCVLVNNGTSAFMALVIACELRGSVMMPAFTFVSTAHVLELMHLHPVFCDIQPLTHNLDVRHCASLINDDVSAIVATHLWGRPADIEGLMALAESHNVSLIFDAAHAFGCTHLGRMLGGFGRASFFSFHATKSFHTFEGGAITTNDADLAARVRKAINFGFVGYDQVDSLGINGKMPEVLAAVGLANLDDYPNVTEAAKKVYTQYHQDLANLPGIKLVTYDESDLHNYHYVVVEVDPRQAGLSRDQILKVLHSEGVLARRYFYPGCHRMAPHHRGRIHLPATERLCERVIVLPAGSDMSIDEVRWVCGLLRVLIEHSSEIRERLTSG